MCFRCAGVVEIATTSHSPRSGSLAFLSASRSSARRPSVSGDEEPAMSDLSELVRGLSPGQRELLLREVAAAAAARPGERAARTVCRR